MSAVRVCTAGAVASLVVVLAACSTGGDGDETEGSAPPPPPRDEQLWDELEAKAKADGTVAVIVTLAVDDSLPPDEVKRVARMRRDALFEELEGTQYSDVVTYQEAPIVALHASPEALGVLRRSANVGAIEEDVPMGIAGG